MNKKLVFAIAFICAVQLFLIFTPLIPATSSFWHKDDPVVFNGVLAAMITAEVTLALFLGQLTITITNADLEKSVRQAVARMPPARISKQSAQDFYLEFLAAAGRAKHSVKIAYLAKYPPDTVGFEYKDRYYKKLLRLMKFRQDVIFRRLIRESEDNLRWAATLVKSLEGKPNNSIAILNDGSGADDMPFTLSVQVVDERETWIVAAEAHEGVQEFRDLFIENADAGETFARYYDRLWSKSKILIENGNITAAGAALVNGESPR